MGAPTISVIVPAYKASATIGRALQSSLAQTHPPDEIIIVDDGSPDDLAAAVAPYRSRVQLQRKANGGAASARNFGIERSRGELLAFLDADDCWEPRRLERQLQILEQHPEVILVASEFSWEDPQSGRRWRAGHVPAADQDRVLQPTGAEVFRIGTRILSSTVLLRRAALGTNRFDVGLRTAEDIDLWVRVVKLGPVFLISDPLCRLVLTEGSLSRSDVDGDCRNMLEVIRRNLDLLGPAGRRRFEAQAYKTCAAGHLAQGCGPLALRPAWKRLQRQPWSAQAWWIFCKSGAWTCTPWIKRQRTAILGK